jgi:hypothetical protein
MAFLVIFLGKKCGKLYIFVQFSSFWVAWKAYLFDFFDSPTTTPGLGTHPAYSWRTKQFLSRPHGL